VYSLCNEKGRFLSGVAFFVSDAQPVHTLKRPVCCSSSARIEGFSVASASVVPDSITEHRVERAAGSSGGSVMFVGMAAATAKVSLAPELSGKDDQSDEQASDYVGGRNAETPGEGKLCNHHQGNRQNGVYQGRCECLATGFQVGSHRAPLRADEQLIINVSCRVRRALQWLHAGIPLLEKAKGIGVSPRPPYNVPFLRDTGLCPGGTGRNSIIGTRGIHARVSDYGRGLRAGLA
jgi:hypothetical protein